MKFEDIRTCKVLSNVILGLFYNSRLRSSLELFHNSPKRAFLQSPR